MPQYCKLSRSRTLRSSFSVASAPLLDFLVPPISQSVLHRSRGAHRSLHAASRDVSFETFFYGSLRQAALCEKHKEVPKQVRHGKSRRHASTATRRMAGATNHQRYDRSGRLIIETTAPRQPASYYEEDSKDKHIDISERHFAQSSRLPSSFFTDINLIRGLLPDAPHNDNQKRSPKQQTEVHPLAGGQPDTKERAKLLSSVRSLEEKLAKAKQQLAASMRQPTLIAAAQQRTTVLKKKDYLDLVDLYFYSHNSRFSPESPDYSPTPIVFDDYSFALSSDFSRPDQPDVDDDMDYVSPLKEIEEQLKQNKLREIAVMQVFIDLLLDDRSSNRALYEAYKELPQPGVSYLPKGVIRLFLQRMSTPWIKSQASKLRYLSLIDDMQQAKLPITRAEWSSAIYLAGRSFSRIDQDQVGKAFAIWREMENEAGVQSSNVTFNILFDVAVRAGKFALGETILGEMHKRNLRLNRLGRVSLIYYHGLRGDGDGARKAYRDFVEAGEIVDTLVLNCVIASLINAGEPEAAEQIYQRMKDMQATLRRRQDDDGREALFKLHPAPGSNMIGDQMASNELGRILERAPNLHQFLPEHHEQLQSAMPLTPNFTTFRIMMAHHCGVSGDLDRLTVLLQEMLENFDIPLFPVVFQLLFKGFAIHGPKLGQSSSKWSKTRLDMVWQSCRTAIIDSHKLEHGLDFSSAKRLPSMKNVNEGMSSVNEAAEAGQSKSRTLSMWEELVIDLAAFPRERLKRVHRFHSTQFDEPSEGFTSPFFQQAHYSAPQPELDDEEGEYSLPNPIKSTISNPGYEKVSPFEDDDLHDMAFKTAGVHSDAEWDRPPSQPHEDMTFASFSAFQPIRDGSPDSRYYLRASKPLVCWLLRAYSRVTGNRTIVEEVWNSVRKIWHPVDDVEAQVVIKVLVRCLRDCDRMSGWG